MKRMVSILVLLVWVSVGFLFSANMGSLPGVMKPSSINVYGDELYILESGVILVYSLKDLKLIRKFGRKGDGPGELQVIPTYSNKLTAYPQYILVETFARLIYFSKDGTLQKEIKKKSPFYFKTIPIGNNFVINKFKQDQKVFYNCLSLFDAEMNEIKEIYSQEHFQQGAVPAIKLDMLLEIALFEVVDDKIFVEESPKGFIIQVYDSKGNKLYRIEKEYEKVKVTDAYENEMMERFKEDPSIKAQGGYEQIKNIFKPRFPKIFPAIQGLYVSNKKIYVQTYKVKKNKEEYVIMDLKGNIIKRVYIHKFDNVTLMGKIQGTKLHTIHNDKLYYLLESEDEEEWELHIEEIK
jgi:hypothetical protein